MNLRILESPFGGRVIKSHEFAGLRLVDGVYSAKTRVPNHAHEQAVFCIALKGECSELYAAKVRKYRALTVEFLPSNRYHSLDFPSSDTRAFSIEFRELKPRFAAALVTSPGPEASSRLTLRKCTQAGQSRVPTA